MSLKASKQNFGDVLAHAVRHTDYAHLAERYPQDFRVCARGRSGPKGPSIDSSRSGSCEQPPDLAGYFSLKQVWGLREWPVPSALSWFQPALGHVLLPARNCTTPEGGTGNE